MLHCINFLLFLYILLKSKRRADLVVSLGIYKILDNKRLVLFLLFVININNTNIKQLQENVKVIQGRETI